MIAGSILTFNDKTTFFTIIALSLFIILAALYCAPLSISASDELVEVHSVIGKRKIQIKGIESVELFRPSVGSFRIYTYRLLASGGYMGYWGLFRESDIGQYMAFYGKASQCFMITMKNGDKFVLGCHNPKEMVDYINSTKELIQNTKEAERR